jgi:hypothetical protein
MESNQIVKEGETVIGYIRPDGEFVSIIDNDLSDLKLLAKEMIQLKVEASEENKNKMFKSIDEIKTEDGLQALIILFKNVYKINLEKISEELN